uniref:Uncharacterized protein n=1 Tax=Oryza barthii TaxID=65489 RepID=A0A0D3HBD4_9ORYZ
MRWYITQTCVRLVTIEDPYIPEIADVDTLYPMQSAPVTHLTGDIAKELYSDTTSLWEKLRDNIAGSLEEMMSALDQMRQKCKRVHQKSTVPQDTGLRTPYWNNRLPLLPLLGLRHRQDPQLPHVVGKACGTVYDKLTGQCSWLGLYQQQKEDHSGIKGLHRYR